MSFLEKLVNEIIIKHKNDISDLCIIFPSRRAGIYFKNILSKKLESPIWSPSVYSIEDFIDNLSPYNITDNVTLVFELYRIYQEVKIEKELETEEISDAEKIIEETESFDGFYQWGLMLLRDFDTVDKFLIDTKTLFKNIKSLKDIEENFPIELQEDFKKFWGTIFLTGETGVKRNFKKIWQLIGDVYIKYKEELNRQNLAYKGMASRKVCEDMISGKLNLKWNKYIFAGFNSLNKCEEIIISYLLEKNLAEIYWDADSYYLKDEKQEAGKFIRRNFKKFGLDLNSYRCDKEFETDSKNIHIIGSPLPIGMTKAFGSELNEFINTNKYVPENTAVILPEEKMLLPVLYSVPESVESLNVTMGYPFSDTPLFSFIKIIKELQQNIKYDKGLNFHYKDIEKLLMHPYVKFQDTSFVYNALNDIKKNNLIYISNNYILNNSGCPAILKAILKSVKDVKEVYEYLSGIVDIIIEKIDSDESREASYKNFQLEYLYNFYTNINLLKDILDKYQVRIEIGTYWKILLEILGTISIPFTGEPLKGLQVMGLLESRTIDFENVFILSMNEGIIPKGNTHNSFIPYSLRKAFGMPTFEDNDALTAYYFYRVLQKAKNIYLFYDTEVGINTKEKSRFILQIENELIRKNTNIKYEHKILVPPVKTNKVNPISVEKNSELLGRINNIKHLSASDLINYINCPLKFYLKKIERLDEQEEVEETFSAATIGSILHFIMKLLYEKYKGQELNENNFDEVKKYLSENYNNFFKSALKEYYSKSNYDIIGKNILSKKIIYRLITQILENERNDLPLKIIDLEYEINTEVIINDNLKVNLKGKIDRIDGKDGLTRILDYKTGTVDLKKLTKKNENEYFGNMIKDDKYKESFQAYFYAYIYKKLNPDKNINVGIYPLKKIKQGLAMLNDSLITDTEYDEFEKSLTKIISDIYDPSIKVTQTDDVRRCQYCPYKQICNR